MLSAKERIERAQGGLAVAWRAVAMATRALSVALEAKSVADGALAVAWRDMAEAKARRDEEAEYGRGVMGETITGGEKWTT